MLKINPKKDIKELEKFGFEPRYDEITGKIIRYINGDEKNIVRYINNDYTRKEPYWEAFLNNNDLLYDLIKADIVVKG